MAADSSVFQVRLLDFRLRLIGPSEEIGPLKESLYTACQEPPDSPANDVWRLEAGAGGYAIRRDGDGSPLLFRSRDRTAVFWWLDGKIFDAALEGADHLLQIHGAASARNGRAVLLVGDSEAGKSTLTLHLVRNGFRFFSDEVIVLDPVSFRLRSFPRNMMFREGTVKADAALAACCKTPWEYQSEEYENIWFFDPARVGADEIGRDAAAGEIICLKKEEGGPALMEPIGARQAVEFLLAQQMNLKAHGERGLDAMIRLAESRPNYLLQSAHAGQAWPVLRDHLNLPPD